MSDVQPNVIGRYAVYAEIAAGGMATVHLGRLLGPVGFARTVAIKRLHQQYAKSAEFVEMFVDEARLAARIRHPNVVPTLDVVALPNELFLVLEYVHGVSLSRLWQLLAASGSCMPVEVACALLVGALHGLHAAHEAHDERGERLEIVHRDVSPQNIMIGSDGLSRVLDFGVAKATYRAQTTRNGHIKGKLSYMAPEQVNGGEVGPWSDVYAVGVVLWEALTNVRLFKNADSTAIWSRFADDERALPPSAHNADVSPALDAIVLRALENDPARRFRSAQELADALEGCVRLASTSTVARWLQDVVRDELQLCSALLAEIERASSDGSRVPALERVLSTFREAAAAREAIVPTADTRLLPAEPVSQPQIVPIPPQRREDGTTPRARRLARLAVSAALLAIAVALPLAFTHAASKAHPASALALPAQKPVPLTPPPPLPAPMPTIAAEDLPLAPSAPHYSHVGLHLAHPIAKSAAAARAAMALATAPAVSEPALDCKPPYLVDSRGIRHMKLACFR